MSTTVPPVAASAVPSPPATRLPGRRWRDWRLLAGVVLVLGSAVAGARLVAVTDHTDPTWAAATDLVPGAVLAPSSLVQVAARVDGPTNPYLTGPVPEGYVLVRPVEAGELVPATAVAPAVELQGRTRLVAVSVDAATTPGELGPGDVVDVWEVPSEGPALLLADGVTVAEARSADTGFGSSADSVVLSLSTGTVTDEELTATVSRLVSASSAGRVVLTTTIGGR